MKTFPLQITSLDGNLFTGDVVKLSLRGTEGEFAIMAGHIPFATAIVPCKCRIEFADGEERVGDTDGGMLTVSGDKVIFLTGSLELA
jgi:F-type H+-transporting ATPase subunit epsilon